MPMGEVANIILNKNLHLFGIKNIFFKSIFSGLWLSEKVGPKSPKVTLVDTIKLQSQLVPPLPSARYHPRTTIRALPSARVQSQSSQLLVPDVSQLRQGLEQNTSHCRCHSVQQGCKQASIMAMGINIDDYFHRIGPPGRFDHRVAMSVVCLSVCLSVPFHVLDFEAYFSPPSWSRMFNIFRDSESLGKKAGKKWSQNWSFLLGSGLKSPHKKKVFFCWFSQHLGSKLGASTEQYLCWSTPFWPLVHS